MDWVLASIGGTLIGLGAVSLMAVSGRIAGISGISGGLTTPQHRDILWRIMFIIGLIGGAIIISLVIPGQFEAPALTGNRLMLAGVLVGFGSVLGNGCTSGHGVCGMARLSKRSFVAVAIFMATAILTVGVMRHGF